MPPQPRDWFEEYRRAVLEQFGQTNAAITGVSTKVDRLSDVVQKMQVDFSTQIARLEMKSAIIGGLIGSVGGAIIGGVVTVIVQGR